MNKSVRRMKIVDFCDTNGAKVKLIFRMVVINHADELV